MGRKKPGRKRSPAPQKDIWTTVKDNAALVAAIIALFGVLITGAVNTYIANKDQAAQRELELVNAQKQRELEQEKAQNAALQTYLDQMGQMLLSQDLRSSAENSELRTLARARTLSVLGQLDPEGKRIALMFLKEAHLSDTDEQIITLNGADLSGADLSHANLSHANMFSTDLSYADLSEADLRDLDGVTEEELISKGYSLEGATMPNGQKYEENSGAE